MKAYKIDFKEIYKELINSGLVIKERRQSKTVYTLTEEGQKIANELLRR